MKIYTFWEPPGAMPVYLDLCIQSWKNNIEKLDLVMINHSNWEEYIGEYYDVEKLKTFSLPIQSDAVAACILATKGGVFMDADTIITKDISKVFDAIADDKFVGFGKPNNKGFHVAVIKNNNVNNPVVQTWFKEIIRKIQEKPDNVVWSYLGNSILDSIFKNEKFFDDYVILDRTIFGNIIESIFLSGDAKTSYQNFWFNKHLTLDPQTVIDKSYFGIISLHNSWTPAPYKIKSLDQIRKDEFLISKVLLSIGKRSQKKSINQFFGHLMSYLK